MLDVLNEQLNARGEEPIAFDSDCREGICGMCGLMISGKAHGPEVTTTCQLHMRSFSDGDVITIEPWRADAFPVIKDLVVDRGAFDRIIQAGGYISANTGSAPEAHSVPVPKHDGRPRLHGGRVHRLRRLRRGLPERVRACSSWARRSPTSASCPRASRSATPASSTWSTQHDARGLRRLHQHRRVLARRARRRSRWTSSTSSTRTCATP